MLQVSSGWAVSPIASCSVQRWVLVIVAKSNSSHTQACVILCQPGKAIDVFASFAKPVLCVWSWVFHLLLVSVEFHLQSLWSLFLKLPCWFVLPAHCAVPSGLVQVCCFQQLGCGFVCCAFPTRDAEELKVPKAAAATLGRSWSRDLPAVPSNWDSLCDPGPVFYTRL